MDNYTLDFSEWAFVKFVLWTILIFAFFRLLRFISLHSSMLIKHQRRFVQYLPFVEFSIWLIFLLWSVGNAARHSPLLAFSGVLLLLYLSFWFSRFVFRDFIAGVVFRFSGQFRINETIHVDGYTGKIVQFRNQTLEIETDKGEIIFLAYTMVLNKAQIKTDKAETIRNHSFELRVNKEKGIETLKQEIISSIIQLPWASVKKKPMVNTLSEAIDFYTLKITVYSIEGEYFHRIEKFVKERFQ